MKRLLFIILCIFLYANGRAQNTYVLVTGVSRYQDENNNLAQTTKDAKAFAELMKSQTKNVSILTSSYASRTGIISMLNKICDTVKPEDRIIFYYSGHGSPGGIYVYDGYLPYSDLIEVFSKANCKEIISFVDACHAGSIVSKKDNSYEWAKRVQQTDMIFYMACRGDEYSYEHPWVGNGYFTQSLLKGLRGKSDSNRDKLITVQELFRYIHADVVRRSDDEQHPQLIASPASYEKILARW